MFLKKIKKFDGTRSICLFGIPVFSYKKSNSKCLSYLSKLGRVCDSSEYARSLGVTVGKSGEVWAGNPARFIKTTDCLAQKFLQTKQDPKQLEYRCLVDCKKG